MILAYYAIVHTEVIYCIHKTFYIEYVQSILLYVYKYSKSSEITEKDINTTNDVDSTSQQCRVPSGLFWILPLIYFLSDADRTLWVHVLHGLTICRVWIFATWELLSSSSRLLRQVTLSFFAAFRSSFI